MTLNFQNNLNFPSNLTGLTDVVNSNLIMTDHDQKKIEEELIGTINHDSNSNYEKQLKKDLNEILNENNQNDNKIQEDNPMLLFHLVDKDGDPHEIVVQIIQRADKF